MPCCDTGRNIQKYKGAAASTLQDVTDNGNTTTGDIITTSGFFIGDGSKLTGISGASAAFTLQETSDRGNTTSNVVQFTNPITSFTASGNVIVSGNVTASSFYGLGTGISEIDPNSLTSAVSISKGGTGSTTATDAASALGVGTEDSPQFTGIKLGDASDTTLLRSSPGVVTIQGQIIRTGDVALGTQTSGNYVKTVTAGDGLDMTGSASEGSDHTLSLDLKANHGLVIDNTELKIDLKTGGGLDFDSGQMRVKLDDTAINGTLPVSKGGTGATTLDNLISLGSHTTGNYVKTVTAGDGLDMTGSADEGSDHTLSLDLKENHGLVIDNTELKIDLKASGGLDFDSGQMCVKLDDTDINGTLPVGKGGTNITTYATGDILIASGTNTLSTLALGTDSYVLTSNSTTGLPEWKSASAIGTTVATLSNTAYIIGGDYNGGGPKTWSLKASTTNSTDHIVIRDNNGNINVSALNVGGTSLTSTAWSGNSATATKLAAAVDIGGQSFDGSANIDLPGVNTTGTVDTNGNAATATKLAAAVDIGGVSFDGSASITPSSIANAPDTASSSERSVAFLNNNQVKTNANLTFKPSTNELKLTNLKITGALTAGSSTGISGQVLKSTGAGVVWGTDNTGGPGTGGSVWLHSGSDPNYIVTTPTPQSNVGISNTYEVTHTLHIGSNVIVSDTGGHDVLRVNGNVFCTNYLFGDGSKIRNLNTIRTETGANQISVGSDDGGPVLSWRERQIRYQYGTTGRPVPSGYGF